VIFKFNESFLLKAYFTNPIIFKFFDAILLFPVVLTGCWRLANLIHRNIKRLSI
jgi:hypothetical protein